MTSPATALLNSPTRFLLSSLVSCLMLAAVVLTGCDTSVAPEAESVPSQDPLSQQVDPGNTTALRSGGHQDQNPPILIDCIEKELGPYTYSVCSATGLVRVGNLYKKQVQFIATIEEVPVKPNAPGFTIRSKTRDGNGSLLQDEVETSQDTPLSTEFTIIYPRSETRIFRHESEFQGDNGTIAFFDVISKNVTY